MPRALDTATGVILPLRPSTEQAGVSVYVCGITPYDATHLGHAATYLAFDTLTRLWLDAGLDVRSVQNVTDVDDPLLERATATGVPWRSLADDQIALFRSDMELLRIIPPTHFAGVSEYIPEIGSAVAELVEAGLGYTVDEDVYFDAIAAEGDAWRLGSESGLDPAAMTALSAERGGDPDRPGKRHPLDPLLWRARREGEPHWDSAVGPGRPGWHIECAEIARHLLGSPITVQGGGSDLAFPHHEFTAAHIAALTGERLAHAFVHTGMVAFEGEKMSKSLGNLVLVSTLAASGTDPRALRLALLAQHYREDWEWTPTLLTAAERRLATWDAWASGGVTGDDLAFVDTLRALVADDLGTPRAVDAIDSHIAESPPSAVVLDAIDALLGIRLAVPRDRTG